MKLTDFKKLKKLLAMTFSDNEQEILTAIRSANAILSKESLTWERVLDRSVQVLSEFEEAPAPAATHTSRSGQGDRNERHPRCREIDDMFKDLGREELGDFEDFVNDVHAKYKQYGSLTGRQYDAIKKAWDRLDR